MTFNSWSFAIYTNFSDPVKTSIGGGMAGASSSVDISRGQNRWTLNLNVPVFSTMPNPYFEK